MPAPPSNDPAPHVLITGVSGFIGAAVARELVSHGATVTGLDDLSAGDPARHASIEAAAERGGGTFRFVQADVRDASTLDGLLAERLDAILHLAARVGVRRVLDDPGGCERENLEGSHALADAIRRADWGRPARSTGTRLLAASTSEVYAESSQPLAEGSALRAIEASGRWRYAASKLRSEAVLDAATPAIHLRFFNVVGPGQDAESGMVLPRFVEAARAGDVLHVHGAGSQVRTLAHVDAVALDVARLTLPRWMGATNAARRFRGPLNVGGAARTTIRDLAERVVAETRRQFGEGTLCDRRVADRLRVVHVDPEVDVAANFEDVRHRVPDLRLLETLGLGASPWDLDSIVSDTVRRHDFGLPAAGVPVVRVADSGAMACASPAS